MLARRDGIQASSLLTKPDPQGFQLLVDVDGGFGGMAASLVDHLADEYEGKTVAAFCTAAPRAAQTKRQADRRVASTAVASTVVASMSWQAWRTRSW